MNNTPRSRTVLCVDDDPDDQVMILETIRELDPTLRVASALNGVEALRFLRTAKARGEAELPCLIILDINMPVMDGKQTLVQIRKEGGLDHIPVVLFTTSSSVLDRTFGEQHGARFVTKPIKHGELYQTIQLLLSFCRK